MKLFDSIREPLDVIRYTLDLKRAQKMYIAFTRTFKLTGLENQLFSFKLVKQHNKAGRGHIVYYHIISATEMSTGESRDAPHIIFYLMTVYHN